MDLLRIASDWHLAPRSPPADGRLAVAFLRRARADGASVILNGDVFDDLFAGAGCGARAHPDVVAELEGLRGEGRLRRLRGNHDPAGGEARVVLEWPAVGRVVVTHGDGIDPLHRSWLGRLGHAISLRAGSFRLVRLAMALAEVTARALLGRRILQGFRTRCIELVAREACALGVFGHVHAQHLAPGDPYANAGWLHGGRLEYLELGPEGARLRVLTIEELAPERVAAG
ncbi:MAG TPA: metallophosphoesterase [Anaeromyxobacter sp.]|nr:metallophosphoesterase [Anaeromyxobacter sp.]